MTFAINHETVEQAVSTLLKIADSYLGNEPKSKQLFEDENGKINLIICVKKIPATKMNHNKVVKVALVHPIFTETTTICLFVKDLTKFKVDDDVTKHHYKELLEAKGVKGIDDIIPLHQLRTEFKPFEAKRHLCNSYELFLADSRIGEDLPELIGREFWKKKRLPVKVNMKAVNLKHEFEKVLGNTYLYTHGRGSTWSLPIAHQSFGEKNVIENILKAIDYFPACIPGGWNNIRSIHLKTQTSLAIPIFLSTDSPNDVQLKKAKKRVFIEAEELSTKMNTKIRVCLNGKVKLIYDKNMADDKSESTDEESDFQDIISSQEKGRLRRKSRGNQRNKKINKRIKKSNKLTE